MVEIQITVPAPIVLEAGDQLTPAEVPNLPADKITSGTFAPERIPSSPIDSKIAEHSGAVDPHPQYATESDLAAHAISTGAGAHLPGGGLTNSHIAATAAIEWGKIDKTGANPADVGAAPSSHTHAGLVTVAAVAPSSPAAADRWFDTTDNQVWFWSGSYWMSEQRYMLSSNFGNLSITASGGSLPVNAAYDVWIESLRFCGKFQVGTFDSSNNWGIRLIRESSLATNVDATLSLPNQVISVAEYQTHVLNVNLHRDSSALSLLVVRNDALRTGTPPNINAAAAVLFYRLVKA